MRLGTPDFGGSFTGKPKGQDSHFFGGPYFETHPSAVIFCFLRFELRHSWAAFLWHPFQLRTHRNPPLTPTLFEAQKAVAFVSPSLQTSDGANFVPISLEFPSATSGRPVSFHRSEFEGARDCSCVKRAPGNGPSRNGPSGFLLGCSLPS